MATAEEPPNMRRLPPHPWFGERGPRDMVDLLYFLSIVFESFASAESPQIFQQRARVAATVCRDIYTMDTPRADVFIERLRYAEAARAKPTRPLYPRVVTDPPGEMLRFKIWNDSEG